MPLKHLDAGGCISIADLSPLKGMPLNDLFLGSGYIKDLSPLKGMKLTNLSMVNMAGVRDFSPIEGMPLESFCADHMATDLRILKGAPLRTLWLANCPQVWDLTPLQGMPLTSINLLACGPISELAPLKGMPLASLTLQSASVSDLSPIRDCPLATLDLNGWKRLEDLSPLKGMKTLLICHSKPPGLGFGKIHKALLGGDCDTALREAGHLVEILEDVPAFRAEHLKAKAMIQETIPVLAAAKQKPDSDLSAFPQFRGHHYLRWDSPATWDDANTFCRQYGAHLATITSKEEDDWIRLTFKTPGQSVLIGGVDRNGDGNWAWVTGEKWSYSKLGDWRTGPVLCVLWYRSDEWGGGTRETPSPFVVEWDR